MGSCIPAYFDWMRNMVWSGIGIPVLVYQARVSGRNAHSFTT